MRADDHDRDQETEALTRAIDLIELLEREGYAVSNRRDGSVWEALVDAPGERWQATGTSEDRALQHVLRAMFPSRVARGLLRAALQRADVRAAPRASSPPLDALAHPDAGWADLAREVLQAVTERAPR